MRERRRAGCPQPAPLAYITVGEGARCEAEWVGWMRLLLNKRQEAVSVDMVSLSFFIFCYVRLADKSRLKALLADLL